MVAVQLNFARIPYGLFRRLSADFRLLGAFALTFIVAIGVAGLSLIPDASWAAMALIMALCGNILTLVLFLYAYRRALDLVNPLVQLSLIVTKTRKIYVCGRGAPIGWFRSYSVTLTHRLQTSRVPITICHALSFFGPTRIGH